MQIASSNRIRTTVPPNSVAIDMHDIDTLDFNLIRMKLQDEDEGPGWPQQKSEAIEVEYKRFLALKRAYPEKDIVPNREVDTFWHQHILDTQKYAEDCDRVFGGFLHHYPYFGMGGEQDYANLCDAFEETVALYREHFSEPWGGTIESRARCRTGCKPMKCK